MKPSLRVLLEGVVDYAGLFPPAKLDMPAATRNFASHLRGPFSWALGRFILPVSRFEEFNFQVADTRGAAQGELWRISALAGSDFRKDLERIKAFNRWHDERDSSPKFAIDTVEVKADSGNSISDYRKTTPDSLRVFFELPVARGSTDLIWSISQAAGLAKIRTGGVSSDMIPPVDSVVGFIDQCLRAGVRFKATAGLHHPMRGEQPLTYEPDSPRAVMHGFLNLLLCAAFLYEGMQADAATEVLAEGTASAFRFDDSGVEWRGNRLPIERISSARRDFVLSFGSCSFKEPLEDLKKIRLL
jgi:hypothetical protein